MPTGVTTAIVDASAEDRLSGCERPRQSRYLISIANRPLISHVIDGLTRGGIERILIASGADVRHKLEPVVVDASCGTDVSFFDTDSAARGWALVSRMRGVVSDSAVLLHPGDCLFAAEIRRLRECFDADRPDLVLLQRPVGHTAGSAGGSGGEATELRRDDPERTALVLGPSVWPVLEQICQRHVSTRKVIEKLLAAGQRVRTCEAGEHWCYRDSPEELLAANRIVLDGISCDSLPAALGEDTDTQGRVVVSPSARVCRSALRGPIVIGPDAVICDSFIGPYTSIGSGATVLGAEIDYTMVLPDAEIRYPGHRLQSSVIGEGALVSKTFELPTGLRLQLGPGATVILD